MIWVWWTVAGLPIALAGAAVRTVAHDHKADRALLPLATTLLVVAAVLVWTAWALLPTTRGGTA